MSFPIPSKSIILLEEAARMARLDHPNIVKIIAVSKLSFSGLNFLFLNSVELCKLVLRPLIVMEWLPGGSLSEYFRHYIRVLVNRKMTHLETLLQEREERERPTIKLREILHILSQVGILLDFKFILV